MSQPIVLAIETSQRRGSVALRDRRGKVHVESLAAELRHDDDLMPAIDRLFTLTGLKPADLTGGTVGVSVGPGGFTGLRIAVSTAKVLAEALGARLVAAPTALVVAERIGPDQITSGPILVVLACKGERFWATRLEHNESGNWSVIEGGEGPAGAADVVLDGVTAVVGDEYLPQMLRQRCESASVPVIEPQFEAAACLAVTRRLLEAGRMVDPLNLAPLYAREPEAVSLWEKRRAAR